MDWGAYRQLAGVSRAAGSSYSYSNWYSKTAPGNPFTLSSSGTFGGTGGSPYGSVVTLNGAWLIMVDSTGGSVYSFSRNTSTGVLTHSSSINVSSYASALGNPALSPNGNYVMIPGETGNGVILSVNSSTGVLSYITTYLPSFYGFNACFNSAGTQICYAGTSSGYIAVAPFNSSNGTLGSYTGFTNTGGAPSQAVYSIYSGYYYVSDYTNNVVYVINTSGGYITYGGYSGMTNPIGVAISSDGKFLYVASAGSNQLFVFSIASGGGMSYVSMYYTASYPTYIAISPDGFSLYLTNQSSGTIYAYARNIVTGTLSNPTAYSTPYSGSSPTGICVSPDNNSVYVSMYYGPTNGINSIQGYQR